MEDILRDNGIDMGQYFGGDIQGNGCCCLMSHSKKITEEFISFFNIIPNDRKKPQTNK